MRISNLAFAFAVVAAIAAPALAETTMAVSDTKVMVADNHKTVADDHKMGVKGHRKRGRKIVTKNGSMKADAHGCLVTLSGDGNRMTMMSPKGDIMVGDKKANTMLMMGPDAKMVAVDKDSKEAKMMMDHMHMMVKK